MTAMSTPFTQRQYVLNTERLIVRTAEHADAPAILRYITENRDFLTPWEPARSPDYYTLAFHQDLIRRETLERDRGVGVRLYLWERTEPSVIVGMINLANFVRGVGQFCTVGYALAEAAQGKGYMSEALTAVVGFSFDELRLHRVQANYIPRNERSGHVLRRCGFVVEGYARDYLMINGTWEDHILTALTNPAWKPPQY
jgi:ribosomal-protein-alanine N-acetyltransferase